MSCGYIQVNDRLQTSVPGVWAIGECAGTPQFTHASVHDFKIVSANMSGENRSTRGRLIPYVLFTEPPLAHVGLTEQEARKQGISVSDSQVAHEPRPENRGDRGNRGFHEGADQQYR